MTRQGPKICYAKRILTGSLPTLRGSFVAVKQMRGQPGIVSFIKKGTRDDVNRFFHRLQLFTFAESLVGVESLICYPYEMTHGSIPAEVKNRISISDRLVRLSVGLEDPDELIEDLKSASPRPRPWQGGRTRQRKGRQEGRKTILGFP